MTENKINNITQLPENETIMRKKIRPKILVTEQERIKTNNDKWSAESKRTTNFNKNLIRNEYWKQFVYILHGFGYKPYAHSKRRGLYIL